jgi:hypothetical protein
MQVHNCIKCLVMNANGSMQDLLKQETSRTNKHNGKGGKHLRYQLCHYCNLEKEPPNKTYWISKTYGGPSPKCIVQLI